MTESKASSCNSLDAKIKLYLKLISFWTLESQETIISLSLVSVSLIWDFLSFATKIEQALSSVVYLSVQCEFMGRI